MATLRAGAEVAQITVAIGPSSATTPRQEVTTFGSVGVTFDFSRGDQIQLSVAGSSAEAAYVDELASDIWLLGLVSQRFRVINVTQDWSPDGDDNIGLTAVSYKRLLNQRHVPPGGLHYAQVDQGDIVWDFWSKTQARTGGNWGVTKGTPTTTGIKRDRDYVEGDNFGQLAENLQNVIDGLWWNVDVNRVYTARLPTQFDFIDQPLQLGVNVRSMQRLSSADGYANVAYGDASEESTTGVWVEAPDLATDPRGRWERAFGWPTVTDQDTLVEHVQGAQQEANTPLAAWNITLEPARWITDTNLMPGDFAVLVVPPSTAAPIGTAAGEVAVQITETNVGFDADGAVSVKIAAIERTVTIPR